MKPTEAQQNASMMKAVTRIWRRDMFSPWYTLSIPRRSQRGYYFFVSELHHAPRRRPFFASLTFGRVVRCSGSVPSICCIVPIRGDDAVRDRWVPSFCCHLILNSKALEIPPIMSQAKRLLPQGGLFGLPLVVQSLLFQAIFAVGRCRRDSSV
jgi:hypothetical protein